MTFPNLAGVATANLVEKIGAGNFSASYINWSRTLNLLREHAPGWLPEVVHAADGGLLHPAPVGAYLLIRFRNGDSLTPAVPQAVMDHRNAAIPREKITARDITDTHRRGICMAAAMTFGLAYELWAKLPLESGYSTPEEEQPKPAAKKAVIKATDGAENFVEGKRKAELEELALDMIQAHREGNDQACIKAWYEPSNWQHEEEKIFVWQLLASESKLRSTLKANKPVAAQAQSERAS